ncbi:hypothetical protein TNCV_225141 [Trichonephila clavipes]|nr:hypothetical protein TNCV_225141 [Trichonephila clavipes]
MAFLHRTGYCFSTDSQNFWQGRVLNQAKCNAAAPSVQTATQFAQMGHLVQNFETPHQYLFAEDVPGVRITHYEYRV